MPKQITQYLCSICYTMHNTYAEAQQCEMLGPPFQQHIVGETLIFEDEHSFGSRWSYSTNSGIILAVATYLNTSLKQHMVEYIVRVNSGEYIVAFTPDGYKSFAENKYNFGFADAYLARQNFLKQNSY